MDKLDSECPAEKAFVSDPDHVECELPPLFRQELPHIVSDLVESCQDMDTFHHLNLVGFPSRGVVIEIVERLKKVVFPGYFGEHEVDSFSLTYQMGIEINTLFELLSRQITLSIRHECRRRQMVCTACSERGQKEALTLLQRLKGLRKILTDDVRAAHGATTGRIDEDLLFYLLARGIDRTTARALLKWAFLSDVLREIELPALRAEAERVAAGQLPDVPPLGALS